jgi:arabinogalactan endo-1,4-beta-galactosidase
MALIIMTAPDTSPSTYGTGQNPTLKVWHSAVILLSVALFGVTLPAEPTTGAKTSQISVVGADFSSVLELEQNGKVFEDGGESAPLEEILQANGVNYSRIRLWVDPAAGSSDLASALRVAERSAAAGMDILLDLHYSDTWADQDNQTVPKAWQNLSQAEMVAQVRTYTQDAVAAFEDQGTPVAMVQLGNEVTGGMLWPWGQVTFEWGEYWDGFAELYIAAAEGARAATPGSPPQILLHSHAGGDIEAATRFFDEAAAHDMPFDVMGLTYYPFWGGSLARFGQGINYLANRYDRGILIVETGYPWTLETPPGCTSVIERGSDLPDEWSYPASPEGQAAYFDDLRDVLEHVPGNHGLGFLAWEPAWLPDVPLSGTCNRYADLTLFDWNGRSLPALSHLAG